MSSFQLQDLKIGPHIAVMLMIESEHLDYHKTFAAYIDAKRNIFRFQTPSDFAVINRDYLVSHESDIFIKGKVFRISREREVTEGCFVRNGKIVIRTLGKEVEIIDIKDIRLLGRHNLENACAGVIAATLAGVSKKNIVKVLSEFSGLEHRLEFVKDVNGIRFYNDSLATIPQATMEALEALPETETLIAGGHDRGLGYVPLAQHLSNGQVKTLILFPPAGIRIWEAICKVVPETSRPKKFDVRAMEQAIRIAAAETSVGKICLLSPASASFGIFKDYKDRGEQFKREVLRLKSIIS